MRILRLACLLAVTGFTAGPAAWAADALLEQPAPAYSAQGLLRLPTHYREWVYLSTGFDMSYTAGATPERHMFDNVFVDPVSYREFLRTGTWRDGTQLVLEIRAARDKGSINQSGHFQDEKTFGLEVHVRDSARFPGGWAFFSFDGATASGKLQPRSADCYTCHAAHAAVDTTFVQFYPTLMPVARNHGTLSPAYTLEETSAH